MSIVAPTQQTGSQWRSYRMTSNQQLIKLGQQKHPDVPLYEVPCVYHLAGDLDVAAFRRAVASLVRGCELLRLRASDADWTDLVVADSLPSRCRYLDFSADADPVLSADEYVRARIVQPLSPTAGLYEACLIRTGATTWQWFLKLHHLLTDGWNTNLLLQHLADFYRGETADEGLQGRDPEPPFHSEPEHPQYHALLEHEQDNRRQAVFATHQQWWQQRVAPLSFDSWYTPPNAEFTLHHHRVVVRLGEADSECLNAAAAASPFRQFSAGLSQFQLFATALSVLLFRLRPDQEVRFGVTSHGRSLPEFRQTLGLFMQLLPFQVAVQPQDGVVDVAGRVAAETRGFLQHCVAGCMGPETATAFDVALNVLDLAVDDFAGLPVAASWRHNGFGDPHRKLTISAHQPQETRDWELIFDFNLQFFPFADHQRVVEQFRGLLLTVAAVPDTPVCRLDWLSPADAQFCRSLDRTEHASDEWSDRSSDEWSAGRRSAGGDAGPLGAVEPTTESALPSTTSVGGPTDEAHATRIWDRFVAVASAAPSAVAIHGSEIAWTYAELQSQAEQLGQELQRADTSPIVPVLCQRSEYAVLSYLAVLSADRVFLPIDADQPAARIQQLLEESAASHVIEAVGRPLLVQRQAAPLTPSQPTGNSHPCYVLYTSGSTGTPNAVVVGDDALWNLLQELERLAPQPGDRCSWWTNVGFDVSIYEVFSAVLYGRALCLPDHSTRQSPPLLFDWLRQQRITSAYLPPFFIEAFAESVAVSGRGDLRRLLVGVEPIPQSTLAQIAAAGMTVVNGYGPTEATICATLQVIDADDHAAGPAPIGTAVRGNVLRIVDPFDEPVPQGRPGELLIGGTGLALGYLGNESLTESRFVRLPGEPSGQPWYRTGDLVRQSADGTLMFLGRTDDQLKIRGQRIEPGEILATLRAIDGVQDAAVDVLRDAAEPLLVAWVCGSLAEDHILTELSQRLPRHCVPARVFVQSDPLPRTANGKPDRDALRARSTPCRLTTLAAGAANSVGETSPENPSASPLEQQLLSFWQGIVGHAECGVTTNLFAAGGDSLDVLRLIAEAEVLGVSLTMSEVFSHPSIRELCRRNSAETPPSTKTAPDVVPSLSLPAKIGRPAVDQEVSAPLSPSQQGMWYVAQTSSVAAACQLQVQVALDGCLDADALAVCVERLIDRHQALSTGICAIDGQPQLSVTPAARMPLEIVSVNGERQLSQRMQEQATRGFAMDGTELTRLQLVTVQDTYSVLVITAHHIMMDQHSIGLILEELSREYSALLSARTRRMLPPAQRASDFGIWREQQRQQARPAHRDFWQEQLASINPTLELPTDRSSQMVGPSAGRLSEFHLPADTTARVRQFAASREVTLHSVLLTAWQILLQRYADESDFAVGVPMSRRGDAGFLNTVGFLIEALPFPCHVDVRASFEQQVQHTDTTFRQVAAASTLSVSDILALVPRLAPGTGRVPYQTMFVLQGEFPPLLFGDAATTGSRVSDLGAAKFDLTLFVTHSRTARELSCQLEYRTSAFNDATVRRIQQHWVTLVDQLVRQPNEPVGAQNFSGPSDDRVRQRCHHHDWTESSLARQPAATVRCDVVNQIQLHVSARPQAVAVSCGDQDVTYEALQQRAADIAAELLRVGVQSGHSVAVLMGRSVDLVASILGILQVGAAYVPIDPQQPSARRQRMLQDAAVAAAVCEQGDAADLADSTGWRVPVIAVGAAVIAPVESVPVPAEASVVAGLAYVLFTSGSTGRAKGVEVSRAALWESTMARQEFYADNPAVFLLLSPFWFDSSVAGLFWTLTTGGALVLPQDDELQDMTQMGRLIQTHTVTHTLCLPAIYRLLLQHAADRLTSLQTVIVAGETCVPQLVAEHHRCLPATRLYNEYGPTEASVWATCSALRREDADGPVSIGRAAPGIRVQLLDDQQQPVPVGVPGEIYLSGTRLAQGYRGQPALTAERFLSIDGDRCYRTGDRARLRSDGRLQFLGRQDAQVKINGQRIELEEIEAVIGECPGVQQVAAALIPVATAPAESLETLADQLLQMPAADVERVLQQVEAAPAISPPEGTSQADQADIRHVGERIHESSGALRVDLSLPGSDFIATPRPRQRRWLIRQALQELLADLTHLDTLAPAFVPGSDQHHLPRDLASAQLSEQEIMEDWQTPLMQAMADYGCAAGDDVLEIGFGRGVAATFIQRRNVASHTIVEMNPHSIADHFHPWRQQYLERDIRLVAGRWQDTAEQLTDYDSIFFHAFPMNEAEFEEHILNSATYAEHFFATAASRLRPGGVFTYMTTEIDSLSRRHQRSLLQHFREIQLKTVTLEIPENTRDAWWVDSMVVIRAIRS